MAFPLTVFVGARIAVESVLRAENERREQQAGTTHVQPRVTEEPENVRPQSALSAIFLGPRR